MLVLIATFLAWRFQRAKVVAVVHPIRTNITETIASSGRVAGVTETLVGAQATGVVETLMVRKGERVAKGQRLAILKNNVAEAQVAQAEQAINTAKAQLSQTSRGPLTSEVEAAAEQVKQAEALVVQQEAAIAQAQQTVAQTCCPAGSAHCSTRSGRETTATQPVSGQGGDRCAGRTGQIAYRRPAGQ